MAKADGRSYGMGIKTVKSPDDVRGLNRKQRNKEPVVKEGLEVSEVIIQEGVYTFEYINDAVAEPVIYMMDHYVVGGFYRVHTGRAKDENLNAPGMHFVPLAVEAPCMLPDSVGYADNIPNRIFVFAFFARQAYIGRAAVWGRKWR